MSLFRTKAKEGKGVYKGEMRPIRPLYFFQIFGRKFWKLIQMNLLYIVMTLPIWIAVGLLIFNENFFVDFSFKFAGSFLYILSLVFIFFSPLIGPSTAGMTYVLKSYATETPVFQYSDFFEQFKKNFKQGTLLSLVTGVFLLSFSFTLMHGDSALIGNGQATLSVLRIPLLVVNLMLIFINYYAYTIMVMFELKFSDLIKNSFIFALAKLPLNLLIFILVCAISYFAYHYLIIGLALNLLILYAFCGFLVVFSIYPTVEKHMLIPAQKQKNDFENIIE
ncbi:MAG: DUF624 domain-containing protein [Clostridia bacterium]|nr:DUF624 domain-containing protein [Clostridia bacterium]